MLRLERDHKKGDSISVKVRDPNRFWNKTLLQALVIAITIHCSAAIIFHVQIFKIIGSERTLPPVHVHSLLTDIMEVGHADTNQKKEKSLWLRKPSSPYPEIPEFPQLGLNRGIELANRESGKTPLFSKIERLEEWYSPAIFDHSLVEGSINITASGGLEGKTFTFDVPPFIGIDQGEDIVYYQVRVDERSGEIIWYEPKMKSNNKAFAAYAEKILENIQLEEVPRGSISSGWIEIAYQGGGS